MVPPPLPIQPSGGPRGAACSVAHTALGGEGGAAGRRPGHGGLQFFVRTQAGKTLTFRLDAECTTEELKRHIRDRSSKDAEGTWLDYGGKRMLEDRPLSDYGVSSGATLWEHGRLRGGMSSGSWAWRDYNAAHTGPGANRPAGGRGAGSRRWPAAPAGSLPASRRVGAGPGVRCAVVSP